MIKNIIFDMDEVLVNLSQHLAKLDGYDSQVLWYIHKFETDGYNTYPKSIERHLESSKCFENCPPMPYYESMKKLIRRLYDKGFKISILSSCMDKDYSDEITRQKNVWLRKYYADEMHMFNEINIVRGSSLKINYVDENSILIDDYLKTQKSFIESGMGDQFILYTEFEKLLDDLTERNII